LVKKERKSVPRAYRNYWLKVSGGVSWIICLLLGNPESARLLICLRGKDISPNSSKNPFLSLSLFFAFCKKSFNQKVAREMFANFNDVQEQ
jgi:hypothetical protein